MKNKILIISVFLIAILIGIFIGYGFTAHQFRKRVPFVQHRKMIEQQRRRFIQTMNPLIKEGKRDRLLLKKAIIERDTSKIDSFVEVVSQDEREIIQKVTHHLLIITKDLPERERERLINTLLQPSPKRDRKRRLR